MSDTSDQNLTEDQLLDSSESDNLPVTPPEDQPRATEWGTTAAEQASEETIDQRIAQEESDPTSAYGAPDNESGLDGPAPVGGDDPDAIPAEDDWVGEPSVAETGELVAPDEGAGPDVDAEMDATLVEDDETDSDGFGPVGGLGGRTGDRSPEESAMRIVEE